MIGKGGVGDVFQAKSQVFVRGTAIKFLPEVFAKDVDRIFSVERIGSSFLSNH